MRKLLLPVLLVALSFPTFPGVFSGVFSGGAGVAYAEDKPKPPASLRELGDRLIELAKRIEKLIKEAEKDADEATIDEYMGYSTAQLKKIRGRVRAQELVGFMVDATKHIDLRTKAMQALHEGAFIRNDPELSDDEKQGSRTKRSAFCKTHLLKHLRHLNRYSRALTQQLLMKLWRPSSQVYPVIAAYKALNEDTWKPAQRAWDKFLKRK